MWNDLKVAFRALRRQPAFATTVVVTLALGIGANTAIFSVLNAVLIRSLAFPNPEELYSLRTITPDGQPTGNVAPREVERLYDTPPSLRALTICFYTEGRIIGPDGTAHNMGRYGVTDQFFEVFNVPMALGRGFTRGEQPGPVVISYSTWQNLFGSDPGVLGKAYEMENGERTIVGVAPPGFDFPGRAGYWTLMQLGRMYENTRAYQGYVRFKPGTTQAQFEQQMAAISNEIGPPPTWGAPVRFAVRPLLEFVVGNLSTTVRILFGATTILMLIAAINVANLLFARGAARTRDVAIRNALGAKRLHLFRYLLTESVLLGAIGGLLGLALAAAGVRLLVRLAPADLPRVASTTIDSSVLLFAGVSSIAISLLVGFFPALRLAGASLSNLVADGGRGASHGARQHRLFGALVVAEIGLAVILVIGAGLLVRSYDKLVNSDPGFRFDQTVAFFVNAPYPSFEMWTDDKGRRMGRGTYQPIATFYRELLERLRNVHGVEAVAATSTLPLAADQWDRLQPYVVIGSAPLAAGEATPTATLRSVSPGFFSTMGIRMLAGRDFTAADRRDAPPVAIVNDTFVRRFFARTSPLGKRVSRTSKTWTTGDPSFQYGEIVANEPEIVGVVSDVKYASLGQTAEPAIYLAVEQGTFRRMTVVLRGSTAEPGNLVPAIRQAITAQDPKLPVAFYLYPDVVRTSLARERLSMTLMSAFGLVALTLAAVGVYGLMSYSVTQRSRELAVRAAFGATAAEILRLIMVRGTSLALGGIVVGVVGAFALRRVVASQLYEVSALDLRVFVFVPLVLLAVAVLATLAPARRAARVDPAELLRAD